MTYLLAVLCLLFMASNIVSIRQTRRAQKKTADTLEQWQRAIRTAEEANANTQSLLTSLKETTANLQQSNQTVSRLLDEKRTLLGLPPGEPRWLQ
jgi:uncharacterized membrane protein